jgi:hypothetical protein
MGSKAIIVARVLLGLVFFVFGLNGFLHWFPLLAARGPQSVRPGSRLDQYRSPGTLSPNERENVVLNSLYIITDEDLAHVSPLLHRHVIPNGTYHFSGAIEGDNLSYNRLPYVFAGRRTSGQMALGVIK